MPTSESHEVAFAIRGPISRRDLPGLCDRVCAVLGRSGVVVACDVAGVDPDAVTVDALARLQLAACRRGCEIHLCNASDDLLELVELMGLTNVLGEDVSRPGTRAEARSAGRPSRRRGRT
jgi:ABC-type transporter Mla MlaB component